MRKQYADGRRLLGTREVAALTGVNPRTLAGWCAAGKIPSARFVRGVLPGAAGAWLISAGDVETVRRIASGRSEKRRAEAELRRCPLTGVYLPGDAAPSPWLRCTIRVIDRDEAMARLAALDEVYRTGEMPALLPGATNQPVLRSGRE